MIDGVYARSARYTVPARMDLAGFRSGLIRCHRFSVGFGAADLTAVQSR